MELRAGAKEGLQLRPPTTVCGTCDIMAPVPGAATKLQGMPHDGRATFRLTKFAEPYCPGFPSASHYPANTTTTSSALDNALLPGASPANTPVRSITRGRPSSKGKNISRSSVPTGLKGKQLSTRDGQFSIMHLGGTGHEMAEPNERCSVGQRSSEMVVENAKRALTNPSRPVRNVSRMAAMAAMVHDQPTQVSSVPTRRTTSLSPVEVREEQARLRALLQSIKPTTVVDQICKALAFFGTPTPSTPDDFPDSAEANGKGSLFVGWMAEIFPELDRKPVPVEPIQPRRKGRPKGSKSAKARVSKALPDEVEVMENHAGISTMQSPGSARVRMVENAPATQERGYTPYIPVRIYYYQILFHVNACLLSFKLHSIMKTTQTLNNIMLLRDFHK